jgi:hypothetical protein
VPPARSYIRGKRTLRPDRSDGSGMRDELLNENLFFGLDHARTRVSAWADDSNKRCPQSALGYVSPAVYDANPHRNMRSAAQPRPAPPIARCSTHAIRRKPRRQLKTSAAGHSGVTLFIAVVRRSPGNLQRNSRWAEAWLQACQVVCRYTRGEDTRYSWHPVALRHVASLNRPGETSPA